MVFILRLLQRYMASILYISCKILIKILLIILFVTFNFDRSLALYYIMLLH